jgi:hypothetical protein
MRCPYCVEGGNSKVMIGQGGSEIWYMCARCGHLTWPTNRFFKCTCAQCEVPPRIVTLNLQRPDW